MNRTVKDVVSILTYQGPTIEELLNEIAIMGLEFIISSKADSTVISVKSNLPYSLLVEDRYIYDLQGKLIKQTLTINGKEKCVFDKFREAQEVLDNCNLRLTHVAI